MKRKPSPINWDHIEDLIHKSFRGNGLSNEEQAEVRAAHAQDPKKYGVLHARVKETVIDTIRKYGA